MPSPESVSAAPAIGFMPRSKLRVRGTQLLLPPDVAVNGLLKVSACDHDGDPNDPNDAPGNECQ